MTDDRQQTIEKVGSKKLQTLGSKLQLLVTNYESRTANYEIRITSLVQRIGLVNMLASKSRTRRWIARFVTIRLKDLRKEGNVKTNQSGFITIVVVAVVAVLVAGGIYYVMSSNSNGDSAAEVSTNSSEPQDSESYPALYRQYGLPEYPGATITYGGRTADNLADGISLTLSTPDDVQTVGAYYESAFSSLSDWEFTPPNFSNDTLYGATAVKNDEGLRYQLTVTKLPDYTQISISFLEI